MVDPLTKKVASIKYETSSASVENVLELLRNYRSALCVDDMVILIVSMFLCKT